MTLQERSLHPETLLHSETLPHSVGGASKQRPGVAAREACARGFSLVETLVASALLVGAMLLATTLFLRSKTDTLVGRRHTEVSRLAGGSQEVLRSLPLDRKALEIPAGQLDLSLEDRWTRDEEWLAEEPAPGAVWWRTTRVRQFAVTDIEDQAPTAPATLDTPLAGGIDPRRSHLRVIEVVVGSEGSGPPGAGGASRVTLVTVRAF